VYNSLNLRRKGSKIKKSDKILVAGAGGFIGGWLVRDLLNDGFDNILAVDIKNISNWYQTFEQVTNKVLDLRDTQNCLEAMEDVKIVYNLAADMGGMGFIENNKALCMLSSREGARLSGIDRQPDEPRRAKGARRGEGVWRQDFQAERCIRVGQARAEGAREFLGLRRSCSRRDELPESARHPLDKKRRWRRASIDPARQVRSEKESLNFLPFSP
jgi:hypothetical protein